MALAGLTPPGRRPQKEGLILFRIKKKSNINSAIKISIRLRIDLMSSCYPFGSSADPIFLSPGASDLRGFGLIIGKVFLNLRLLV